MEWRSPPRWDVASSGRGAFSDDTTHRCALVMKDWRGKLLLEQELLGSTARGTATSRRDVAVAVLRAVSDQVATRGHSTGVKAVAVKEPKNRLSHYLREVVAGEVVLVTDRGKVIAELRRPSAGPRLDFEQSLEPLVAQGVLVRGLPQDRRAYRRTRATLGRPSQALLDAERADP
jgi:antitoxin (DNA-binding transcriptional repressor) of toxin-antitoxin stability system